MTYEWLTIAVSHSRIYKDWHLCYTWNAAFAAKKQERMDQI